MKTDLQLDKQQFENLLAGIWLGNAEVLALVEQLGSSAASKYGFTHLLLSALANRSGAIDTAESHIYKAFTADPGLLKKLLPPESPNHGAALASEYPMTQIDTCPVCRSGERRSVFAGLARIFHEQYRLRFFVVFLGCVVLFVGWGFRFFVAEAQGPLPHGSCRAGCSFFASFAPWVGAWGC